MPALIHFGRRWLIACDDFVIPSAIESFIRFIWLLTAILMMFLNKFEYCNNKITNYLLYAIIGDLICTTTLCVIISILSSRGSVLEVEKRAYLPNVLYVKCVTFLVDAAIAGFSVWYLYQESNICNPHKVLIQVTAICICLYLLAVIVGILICYNSLGSSQYWNSKASSDSFKLFKQVEQIWRFRLKFFCCCADVSEEENDFIYVEISTFLTTLSSVIDVAPTDILAGLITLGKKHAIERRKPLPQEVINSDLILTNNSAPFWMTGDNALYFLRIAKSTYGCIAFCDPLQPWKMCSLISYGRCFHNCFGQQDERKQGDCFDCNSNAFERISGHSSSEILYACFSNSVYEPAFVVLLDHLKQSLIIAIRGTSSFSDFITDMDGEQLDFPSFPRLKCHRGTLRSAMYIQKKINDLNILNSVFAENPQYNLVLCGHSLGGSIAAVLGMLLHSKYPTLQCYSYAPLPVVSSEGIFKTLDFVYTVAVEDDMVVRVSANSIKQLRKEMCKSLEEINIPKYKLLLQTFQFYLRKILNIQKKPILTSQVYENKEIYEPTVTVEANKSLEHEEEIAVDQKHLYVPGRILHLRREEMHNYSWTTGFHFQKIIVSPYMVKDHQPHQIQFFLEKYNLSENPCEHVELEDICTKL